MQKKGQVALNSLVPITIILVVLAVVLGLGADILTEMRTGYTVNGFAYNATTDGLQSADKLSGFEPTIALVIAAAAIIGIVGLLRT